MNFGSVLCVDKKLMDMNYAIGSKWALVNELSLPGSRREAIQS
jgi:hypothetical protein